MAVRIVRLGTRRLSGEGLRIGTVRRPPRGVARARFAPDNWYDVWFPNLAPSAEVVSIAKSGDSERLWKMFVRRYRAEMAVADRRREIELLAALSHHSNFSVGCYCENEARCHRSLLRELLLEQGASVV